MQYCCILFASYTIYNQEARTKIPDFFFTLSEKKTGAFRIHNFISGSIAYSNFETAINVRIEDYVLTSLGVGIQDLDTTTALHPFAIRT